MFVLCIIQACLLLLVNSEYVHISTHDDFSLVDENTTGVLIKSSVTNVPAHVFSNHSKIRNVIFQSTFEGDSTLTIGDYAFYNMTNLVNVAWTNRITRIGTYAFAKSIRLTEVAFIRQLKTIENFAFSNCTGLQKVHIGKDVEYVGGNAFENTNITSFKDDSNLNLTLSSCTDVLQGCLCTNRVNCFPKYYCDVLHHDTFTFIDCSYASINVYELESIINSLAVPFTLHITTTTINRPLNLETIITDKAQKIFITDVEIEQPTSEFKLACGGLEELHLVKNKMYDLPEAFFQNCNRLKELHLTNNTIPEHQLAHLSILPQIISLKTWTGSNESDTFPFNTSLYKLQRIDTLETYIENKHASMMPETTIPSGTTAFESFGVFIIVLSVNVVLGGVNGYLFYTKQ